MSTDELERGRAHSRAAEAFVEAVRERNLPAVEGLYLFGSTARGEASGLSSDVDFLAVVSDAADTQGTAEKLRDIAYDVMLEYGPVVEIHAISRSSFEARREGGHPFVRRVIAEGRSYV